MKRLCWVFLTATTACACELFFPLGEFKAGVLPDAAADVSSEGSTCLSLHDDFSSADASASTWFPLGTPRFFDGFGELTPYDYNAAGGLLWKTPSPLDAYDIQFEVSSIYVPPANGGETPISTGIAFVALDTGAIGIGCRSGDQLCELGGATPGYAVVLQLCFYECPDLTKLPILVTATEQYPDGGLLDGDVALAPTVLTAAANVAAASAAPSAGSWHKVEVQVAAGSATVLLDGTTILGQAPIQGNASFQGYWGFGAGDANRTRNLVRNVVMSVGPGCKSGP